MLKRILNECEFVYSVVNSVYTGWRVLVKIMTLRFVSKTLLSKVCVAGVQSIDVLIIAVFFLLGF